MIKYQEILNDSLIKNIYEQVDHFEPNPWSTHGLKHINNVILYAIKIYNCLELPKDTLDECLIACALHDTGAILGKPGHNERSFRFAQDYLWFCDLTEKQIKNITNAILHHGKSNINSPLIEKVLVLADKLDITASRIMPYGYQVEGMRQIGQIEKVNLKKTESELEVEILTTPKFNQEEWENYYFTAKVYDAISVMAHHAHLAPKVKYVDILSNKINLANLPSQNANPEK